MRKSAANRRGGEIKRRTAPRIVKNGPPRQLKKQAKPHAAKLARTTFLTSREMDFFSEKELTTQVGHPIGEWPLVILKELIDNGLDACEEADLAPTIDVRADGTGITVKDNGPGLPAATLAGALDFTVRASNREMYVAPDRGAQGNALKTLIPMPAVIDPEHGRMIVQAHSKHHEITCRADPVLQHVRVHDHVTESPAAGTEVRLEWSPRTDASGETLWPFGILHPRSSSSIWCPTFAQRFRAIVEGFAVFNPHATIRLDWFGERTTWAATDPEWEKWKPHRPTSPHWYAPAHLMRQIGAYIRHDLHAGTDRLVSTFVAEFDGLTASQKRANVLDETGLKRAHLSELMVNDRLDNARIERLLAAMKAHTRPVKPRRLGIIGEAHVRQRLLAMGVKPESFRYSRRLSKAGLPWVLESAFGWLGREANDLRRIFAGANWSSAIGNPFRVFGSTGEGLETALADCRATRNEPVVFVLHLAHPRIEYVDRGKSALVIEGDDA